MERLSVARDEKEDSPRIANLDKQIQALQREQEGSSLIHPLTRPTRPPNQLVLITQLLYPPFRPFVSNPYF